jgi:hypothetical protein
MKKILQSDLEYILETKFSPTIKEEFKSFDLRYEEITSEERDAYILDIVETLVNKSLPIAGENRLPDWEKGWKENLDEFKQTRNINLLLPKYHHKYALAHWKQKIIKPLTLNLNYKLHRVITDWVIETYLSNVDNIYEFGCGPAYNLLNARKFNSKAHLVGLDWTKASQDIINEIVHMKIDNNIEGRNFDFYKPDYSLDIPDNSGVITIAALEQVGCNFGPFLDYLLDKKPSVCVHIEPIEELLNPENLIDKLSILYFWKRNYLCGFLTKLRELRDQGRIEIIREQRTYEGSYFIEGHSIVVWRALY